VVVVVGRAVVGVVVTGGEVGGGDGVGFADGAGATATGADDTGADAGEVGLGAAVDVPPVFADPTVAATEPDGADDCSTATAGPVSTIGSEPARVPEVTSSSTVDGPPVADDWVLRARAATIEAVAARLIPAVMALDAGATVPERRRGTRAARTGPVSVVIVALILVFVLALLALPFLLAIVAATSRGRGGDGRRRRGRSTGNRRQRGRGRRWR